MSNEESGIQIQVSNFPPDKLAILRWDAERNGVNLSAASVVRYGAIQRVRELITLGGIPADVLEAPDAT